VIGRSEEKHFKVGGAGGQQGPLWGSGQCPGGRPGDTVPVSSWILAFLSIAEGISKVSFFRKMKWKKVNFSTKIY
jgi:hypothetical protein